MKTIGLIGGVASGKSTAARLLVEFGAGLLDADRTGHAVMAEDAEVRQAVRERWGDAVFTAAGGVDRRALAHRVFGSDAEAQADRQFLEGLLHPRIRQRLEELRAKFAAEGRPAVVLDAPLLLEAGWGPMCDVVLMIDAPREARLRRARQRGWRDADFAHREAAQWPVQQKRHSAHMVIANDATEADFRKALQNFWQQYVRDWDK